MVIQNISNSFFSTQNFDLIFFNMVFYFLKLKNGLNYFIYAGRVLKRSIVELVVSLTHKFISFLNFKLIVLNICLILQSFIRDTNYWYKLTQSSRTESKIWKLSSKNIHNVKAGDALNYKQKKIKIKYECSAHDTISFYCIAG